MAFIRLVFTVLVLSVLCNGSVPVFLWGDLTNLPSKSYPLATTSTIEFTEILEKELAPKPVAVVFIEESLSVEDFSTKNALGVSPFPYLESKLSKALYIPAVANPLLAINTISDPENVDTIKLTENGLSAEIEPKPSKFLLIHLKDAKEGEARSDLLTRHNDFIQTTMENLRSKFKNLVAIYTAEFPSWIIPDHTRVRRQAETQSVQKNGSVYILEGLRFFASEIRVRDSSNENVLGDIISADTVVSVENGTQATTLNFNDDKIVMNFKTEYGYWFFDSVVVTSAGSTEELYPDPEVYSLMDWSYRCGPNVTFTAANSTKSISIRNMQIQPYFSSNNTDLPFGDEFNCVGWFSVPIWAGLFVTFILLAITFYGIMMMMDIRTMDRFDDPKGKTITISAVE